MQLIAIVSQKSERSESMNLSEFTRSQYSNKKENKKKNSLRQKNSFIQFNFTQDNENSPQDESVEKKLEII
ncbi:CLUMA_CG006826, isoform A [Clunio marinus]|uniref:CLUMA_CG006826, isoform A n=1 Tax=Clunio marinus TaxID=568069 RepID=A0A1J1HZA0_9DIPT|nr:CLUMA_CG006826, isoform A [Clunio marinus]